MGFPYNFKLHEKNSINYNHIGNAVSPNIIKNIKKELKIQNFI